MNGERRHYVLLRTAGDTALPSSRFEEPDPPVRMPTTWKPADRSSLKVGTEPELVNPVATYFAGRL